MYEVILPGARGQGWYTYCFATLLAAQVFAASFEGAAEVWHQGVQVS